MLALILAAAVSAPLHTYGGVALAPRADRVASVDALEGAPGEKAPHGAVTLRDARSGAVLARLDPCPACTYAAPAWSPDGTALAFLAKDEKAGSVAVDVVASGAVRTVATVKGEANTPRWSPDGTTIALLATVGARKAIGATQAGIPLVGEIASQDDEQRIAVVPVRGGALRLVSPADTFVYEYDWTPDGRGFVATSATGNGDNNWWVARLDAIALNGAVREIAAPPLQMNVPRVSPDGSTVAFVGGLMSDFGSIGGDLYTVPFAGGTPVDATPQFAGSFTGLVWNGPRTLDATALAGDRSAVVTVDVATHATRTLAAQAASFAASDGHVSFSADRGAIAAVVQDFERAPRLVAGAPDALRALTHDNDAAPAAVAARSISWTNDGFHAQGWLLAPRTLAPKKTYPMIVLVHGGPGAAAQPSFVARGTVADLVAHGYFVFEPNPRGSFGQGEAFTRANVRDFGGGDLRDILAGVDAVEKQAPIDDKRLGVYGHSYGGYMTMWTVTNSQRFHAAVAGAGIANWISYYGENGIDQWMIPFFGASAYDDPAVYRAASPIVHIKEAHTPTFVYVGERDVECPPAQSLEFWHGLHEMGVPTSLVLYAGEGHGIRQPAHVKDLAARIVGWFDRYMRG